MTTYPTTSANLSTWTALASFAIGTSFFVAYKTNLFTEEEVPIVFYGFYFVCAAVIVNAAMLLNLFVLFCMHRELREYLAIKMLIVMANIPVTIAYLHML